MALVACRECGKQVSTEAAACPSCGAKPPADSISRASILKWILAAIIVIPMVRCIADDKPKPPVDPGAAALQKQRAAAEEKQFSIAYDVTKAIRKSMRDPSSTVFEVVGVNADATVVCVEYRSRNGFGGMNREAAIYVGGNIKKATKALIDKHCVGLSDQKAAAAD